MVKNLNENGPAELEIREFSPYDESNTKDAIKLA
jgi:hypothetical protein